MQTLQRNLILGDLFDLLRLKMPGHDRRAAILARVEKYGPVSR